MIITPRPSAGAMLALSLVTGACSSSSGDGGVNADAEHDAGFLDARLPYDTGFADAIAYDALPCVVTLPPTRIVEDYCRTADGMIDYTGVCMVENPSNEF